MKEHESVKRYNDQFHCATCGKQWDIDDNEPPGCIEDDESNG